MNNFNRSTALAAAVLSLVVGAQAATTTRVSVATGGGQATGGNSPEVSGARISADGTIVVFKSLATNLVAGDTNGVSDIFIRDLAAGTTTRIVGLGGAQGNAASSNPSLSNDGRYVSFTSYADNLVANDVNGTRDVFVYDRQTGTIAMASVNALGFQGNLDSDSSSISADGELVIFRSLATNWGINDSNGKSDVFVKNMATGTLAMVSVNAGGTDSGNGHSGFLTPCISADGRYVGFSSDATNLVTGDTNALYDVFRRDLLTSTTIRVSVSNSGAQSNNTSYSSQLSADGRYVAFSSYATNLVTGDTNGLGDVLVRDCTSGTTTRASMSYLNKQLTGGHSGEGNGDGWGIAISADGRYVAFQTLATNSVSKDTNGVSDVVVRDRTANTTTLISANTTAKVGNGASTVPSISGNGLKVTFASFATNLVSGDTNGLQDVFLRQ